MSAIVSIACFGHFLAMGKFASDVAFSDAVKKVQSARGSRDAYARVEQRGGFETEITDELRAFLTQIDTAFLATASADGQPYVQHRGGAPGFIRAVDEHTLGFLDYVGNRQYVSTGNLTENDRVCLFLMDYARKQRVKVWGTARAVTATPELVAQLGPSGGRTKIEQVLLITVSAWDVNCSQHIPQKVNADAVAETIAQLRARIAELEDHERRRDR